MNDDILYDVNLDDESYTSSNPLEVIAEQSKKEPSAIPEMPTINGKNLYDFEIDSFKDKPWKKPGADKTDHFNYGFDEHTWKLYCMRQRNLKDEYRNVVKEGDTVSPIAERRRVGRNREDYKKKDDRKRRHYK